MQELNNSSRSTLRCAIYTRKSTEEGLDRDFNSLDAQREAAQAFIRSQQREGWKAVPARYDDGGFTGANMERPALANLLAAVRAREVDCVVVYKVDRLSRSLLDFARIMSLFEEYQVSFVSVTQQFNTSTSLGRLTLHILLSFAQFERELIGERTRDKISAARKKGKWTGGPPVLGFDVDPRRKRLVVNPGEADRVREIFSLFEQHRSFLKTLEELEHRRWRLKCWTRADGTVHEGGLFNYCSLRRFLTNVLYTGNLRYRGVIYPGEHEAILDADTWERVQSLLRHYKPEIAPRNKVVALLRGLLFCETCQKLMRPIHTGRIGRRYRYYVCRKLGQQGALRCPSRAIPAHDLDHAVFSQVGVHEAGELPKDLPAQIELLRRRVERVSYDGRTGRVSIRLRDPVNDGEETKLSR